MATEIEAGRALTYSAAWLKDRGRPFAQEAAMAKLYAAELACRVADEAVQIHGGYGYMDEYADLALLPRRQDPRDRRGHERDPAARDRPRPGPAMIFEQLIHRDLGCAAYVVGCQASGEAVVVDPPLDVAALAMLRATARLVAVLETHTHADHVSGHGTLALERGVPVARARPGGRGVPARAARGRRPDRVGNIELESRDTPGPPARSTRSSSSSTTRAPTSRGSR